MKKETKDLVFYVGGALTSIAVFGTSLLGIGLAAYPAYKAIKTFKK